MAVTFELVGIEGTTPQDVDNCKNGVINPAFNAYTTDSKKLLLADILTLTSACTQSLECGCQCEVGKKSGQTTPALRISGSYACPSGQQKSADNYCG